MIDWTATQYSGFEGRAGGIRLFSVSWHTIRNDPNYVMRTELPGYAHRTWKHDNAAILKAKAETFLQAWMAKVSTNAR